MKGNARIQKGGGGAYNQPQKEKAILGEAEAREPLWGEALAEGSFPKRVKGVPQGIPLLYKSPWFPARRRISNQKKECFKKPTTTDA